MKNKIFRRFHKDLITLKAHHWKYWLDLYAGCSHNCQYCLYRRSQSCGKTSKSVVAYPFEAIDAASKKILNNHGIVYVGATADVYQPIEGALKQTRKVLKLSLSMKIPIFIATKSPLILRDIDVLEEMGEKNLVEVSLTLVSLDQRFNDLVEPGAPSVEKRLIAADTLNQHNVPVSFHVAPIIPGLLSKNKAYNLIMALQHTGAVGMYACILGLRRPYRDSLLEILAYYKPSLARSLQQIYALKSEKQAVTPLQNVVIDEMTMFKNICKELGFGFFCENVPAFDTKTREGGIFNFKLPTTGDMYRFLAGLKQARYCLNDLKAYLLKFPSVDKQFLRLVEREWTKGKLFEGTYIRPHTQVQVTADSNRSIATHKITDYCLCDELDTNFSEVMTCD